MLENQNLVHHLIIVDEAIQNIEMRELIYQVNQTIHAIRTESIRNEHQEHKITLYLSSHRGLRCMYASKPAIIASLVHIENFNTLPCKSNIYDAIGVGIGTLKVAAYRAGEPVSQQVTIFSNIQDEASMKYSCCNLKSLISLLRQEGWMFTMVGFMSHLGDSAKEIGIHMCCVLKSTARSQDSTSVLSIMKRHWIMKNGMYKNGIKKERKKIEAA